MMIASSHVRLLTVSEETFKLLIAWGVSRGSPGSDLAVKASQCFNLGIDLQGRSAQSMLRDVRDLLCRLVMWGASRMSDFACIV